MVCASTGNTSASAAAYAAKAGMHVRRARARRGRWRSARWRPPSSHGARMLEVDGNFDASLDVARDLAERFPVTLVNSVNPFRLQGQKTAAFEICDALGRAPDVHCVPVGNAGNISSHWLGYSGVPRRRRDLGAAPALRVPGRRGGADRARRAGGRSADDRDRDQDREPRVVGRPRRPRLELRKGASSPSPTGRSWPPTVGSLARGCSSSRPAPRASPGLLHLHADGVLPAGATVVCVLTGHGLKDPEWAISGAARPPPSRPSARGGRGRARL